MKRSPMPPHHVVDLLRMLNRADVSAVKHAYPDGMIRVSRSCLDSLVGALEELHTLMKRPTTHASANGNGHRPAISVVAFSTRRCDFCKRTDYLSALTITRRGRAYHKRCNAAYQRNYQARRRSA